MKTQTHTPGPWKVSSCSDGREIVSHSCGITFPIAEACDGLGKANGLKEAQSNARLIASAPELLAECKRSLDEIVSALSGGIVEQFTPGMLKRWGIGLERIISKAEGRI